MRSIEITSLKLNDKDKQCRYSTTIKHIAQSVASSSGSAFKELSILLLIFPGIKKLQRRNSKGIVKYGKSPVPYQQHKATKMATNKIREKGYLQVDEMELKHGVVFNSINGEAIGLADDMLDMENIMSRILSEEGDTVEAAVYVNQWQYVKFGPKGLETWPCE